MKPSRAARGQSHPGSNGERNLPFAPCPSQGSTGHDSPNKSRAGNLGGGAGGLHPSMPKVESS